MEFSHENFDMTFQSTWPHVLWTKISFGKNCFLAKISSYPISEPFGVKGSSIHRCITVEMNISVVSAITMSTRRGGIIRGIYYQTFQTSIINVYQNDILIKCKKSILLLIHYTHHELSNSKHHNKNQLTLGLISSP